jgi:hypothetical protein
VKECQAIKERRELTNAIRKALGDQRPSRGTEDEMMESFAYLRGAVMEYQQGGDQLVENCSCGQHNL